MRKVLRVARREYRANVRTKGFVISIVIAPVLMAGSGLAFALLEDRFDTADERIALIDRSGLVADTLVEAVAVRNASAVHDPDSGRKIADAWFIEVEEPATDARRCSG